MAKIARVRDISQITEDIKRDAEKINKDFNKQVAEEFQQIYRKEADDWYDKNVPKTGNYERTFQLRDKALLVTKEDEYGKKISLSGSRIKTRRWKKPTKIITPYGSYLSYKGTMGSYISYFGQNIASDVLEWEEMGYNNFAEYGYGKGNGVWGSSLKKTIEKIDKIKINKDLKLYAPEKIIEDLFNLLKNETKRIMQERYNELFL